MFFLYDNGPTNGGELDLAVVQAAMETIGVYSSGFSGFQTGFVLDIFDSGTTAFIKALSRRSDHSVM